MFRVNPQGPLARVLTTFRRLFALATLALVPALAPAANVTLAWDAVTGAPVAGYTLHWGTAPGVYSQQLDAGNVTTGTITGLAEGSTYYYVVTAYDASSARSGYSNEVSGAVPYAAPVANFTVSATFGTAPLSVNFTNTSTGTITSYAWTFGDGTTSTAPSPAKTYAAAGVYTVTLTVTGPGGSNTRTSTNLITVTAPTDTTAPSAPASLTATANGTAAVNLTWAAATDNVGVTGYRVERCTGASCTSFAQIATPTTTSFADSGLTASTTYRYRVRATDAAGNLGAYSPIASAETATPPDTTAPSAPASLTATANGTAAVNLTWAAATDNVGVTGYRVERCTGASCTSFAQIATPATTSFADSGLTASTTYRYRVRATDAAGNLGAYSPIASATTTVGAPVASFTATPRTGTAPVTVNFTSTSTGSITGYAWSFGDGTTSTAANPSKIYSVAGSYAVALTVTGPGGSHTATQTGYISVAAPAASLQNVGVSIDNATAPGTTSNVNGILEPGETVLVAPTWSMTAGQPVTVSASARVSGQSSTSFALNDASAAYGTLSIGTTTDCQSATGNCYLLSVASNARRPALKWGITFTETLSTGAVVNRTIPIGRTFSDVAPPDPFYAMIEALAWNGVTLGFGDGTFRPTLGISRWQTAMFLARGAKRSDPTFPVSGTIGGRTYNCATGGTSLFADVPPNDAGCPQIHYLASLGTNVSFECGGAGLACPGAATSRGAMAVLLAGAISGTGDAGVPFTGTFNDSGAARSYNCAVTGGSHFSDVPSSAAYCRHANYLWARGVLDGYGDGTFHAEFPLMRGQMAKVIANGFRLTMD